MLAITVVETGRTVRRVAGEHMSDMVDVGRVGSGWQGDCEVRPSMGQSGPVRIFLKKINSPESAE